MADLENPLTANGANAASVKPAKAAARPPSVMVPRIAAALAMATLLAIPVVIPVVIMKVTGKSGASRYALENNIVAPPTIVASPPDETTPAEEAAAFLKINGTMFERFCRPYYTAGFNAYELVEAAMVDSNNALTVGGRSGAQIVDDTLRDAASRGINTIRMWGHTTNGLYPFQVAPGKYDTRGLASLDFVLETARKYGLQVIISVIDNWKYYNGVDQYLDWSTTMPPRSSQYPAPKDQNGDPNPQDYASTAQQNYEVARHAKFYTDPDAQQFYKNHVAFIINRTNTINGRKYRDDPTILAWNMINEPRCESWLAANSACPDQVQAWLETMAAWIRTNDPNHLITVGSEGFYGAPSKYNNNTDLTRYNPASWGSTMGQDFIRNTQIPNVDYATVHAWPDNWQIPQEQTAQFLDQWINSHIDSASSWAAPKPVLFEEFGKKLDPDQYDAAAIAALRDPIYDSTYQSVEAAITANKPIAGSLFWKWAIPVFQKQDPRGPYGVLPTDSTMQYVQGHADFMKYKLNSLPPNPGCGLKSWVRNDATSTCVSIDGLGEAYYALYPANGSAGTTVAALTAQNKFTPQAIQAAQDIRAGKLLVFPTEAYCCKPGTGAFPQGCANTQ